MRIWDISNSPYESPFLKGGVQFGSKNPIFLIDQYDGKRPALLNKEFFEAGKLDIKMYPSVILDSNVMDALNKRIRRDHCTDGVDGLLLFLAKRNWDSSPLFYFFEYFAKSNDNDFISFASEKTESLIKVHAMDNNHFIDTGEIIVNDESFHHYTQSIGVRTLYEVARYRVEKFAKSYKREYLTNMVESIKIALIKMVMINEFEMKNSSPESKHEEFIRFLRRDLGIMLAREAHLALHYFCGMSGKLLGIRQNTSSEKIAKIVSSTAWDMYLVRFQDILFSLNIDKDLCVGYMATSEVSLCDLANLYSIDHIIQSADHGFIPAIRYNTDAIPGSIVDTVSKREADASPPMRSSSQAIKPPIGLLDALQRELLSACARASNSSPC